MTIDTSRRTFLGVTTALSLAGLAARAAATSEPGIEADLRRYVGFGSKRAGGPGDMACGEWLATRLHNAGYAIERQKFAVPYFETTRADLTCGTSSAKVLPQPIVIPTGEKGVSGPLVRVDSRGRFMGSMRGAIALVDLPAARWSSMMAKAARQPVELRFRGGRQGCGGHH